MFTLLTKFSARNIEIIVANQHVCEKETRHLYLACHWKQEAYNDN
jgi:hypothetical protein